MDSLLRDLRYAGRALAGSPAFTAIAVLCLALGMGVNSTVYSVVDTVSIRPLPFHDPERLVRLVTTQQAAGVVRGGASYPDLQDWMEGATAFAGMAGYAGRNLTISDGRDAERVIGAFVSWNLFPLLGVEPVLGRPFAPDDDRVGAARVVLLGHGLWSRRFLADPAIVGQTVLVNGAPHTVIGVMPPRFQFTEISQVWLPLAPDQATATRRQRSVVVYARLAPGVPLEQARADIAAVASRLTGHPENEGRSASAIPLREELMPQDVRLATTTMMGAVTLVLLIACANVANLLLARASVRHREIALRTALGAGRWRIVRQMLTESVLLALVAAPLGVLIAYVGLHWLTMSVPEDDVPYYIDWALNRRAVFYTGAAAVVTGLVFGLAPALSASAPDLHRSLKEGGRTMGGSLRRNRLRSGLVVAEVALSLVLLVGASLFARSFLNLQGADPGIDTGPLMTLRVFMAGEPYADAPARARRMEDIVQRVAAIPGVESLFASNLVPLNGGGGGDGVQTAEAAFAPGTEPQMTYFGVTAGVRQTLGLPLLAGRDLADHEGLSRSGVALVNRDFAKRLWPDAADVLGRQFRLVNTAPNEWFTIVGVVGDFRPWNVGAGEATPFAFVAYPYMPSPNTGLTIRVAGAAPASITPAVREAIRESDAQLPLFDLYTGEENRARSYWGDRVLGGMFMVFGGVALFLAWIGLYGVLSYAVVQRTQELGIRVALGAGRPDVFRLVLGHGARLAGIGVALGLVGAFGVTRVVRSLLYNVETTDPISFAGTAALLVAAALLASYLPARRAMAVDPIVALRTE